MNVLVVAPHFPPAHTGGVEAYTQALADALHARGHKVCVAAVSGVRTGAADACVAEVEQRPYAVHRLRLTLAASRRFPLLWAHAPAEDALDALIAAERVDVVHVHSGYLTGAPAIAAARRRGVPVVLTLHDYWHLCPRINLLQPDGTVCSGPEAAAKCAWCLSADRRSVRAAEAVLGARAARWLLAGAKAGLALGAVTAAVDERQRGLRELLGGVSAVLAPTAYVAERNAAAGLPDGRVRTVRCGIPTMRAPRRQHGDGALRLVYLGQVAPHKGVHLAIEAVRSLPSAALTLDIHGPLDAYPAYVRRLRELAGGDDRIRWRGPYDRSALAGVLAEADAVVVPSVCHEVAPLVIQEAQAIGVPVVGARMGGIPELVADGQDGLLFDPFVRGALGMALQRLLDAPMLLAQLAARSPQPRDITEDAASLVALYASLVGRA